MGTCRGIFTLINERMFGYNFGERMFVGGIELLKDSERKLLRILSNYLSRHNKLPTLEQLETMAGKRKDQIIQALMELEKQGFIRWENKSSVEYVVILQAWENGMSSIKSPNISRGADYWTMY